jgi:hypothetical protein
MALAIDAVHPFVYTLDHAEAGSNAPDGKARATTVILGAGSPEPQPKHTSCQSAHNEEKSRLPSGQK